MVRSNGCMSRGRVSLSFKRVLIANRGEIAIRIARAAAELGVTSVAVYAEDDAASLHTRAADEAVALRGTGVKAYLDIDGVIAAAKAAKCDAIHPGYGFLSENAAFARACAAAKIAFIGPSPDALELFGDKAKARALAAKAKVPVLAGTGAIDLAGARAFFKKNGPMMLKAVAGGGGRGMRIVQTEAEIEFALAACSREALAAFGDGAVYAEWLVADARHIEVQVVADGRGVLAVGDRDCSIQRRNQKLVESAPAILPDALRKALYEAAERLCAAVKYRTLATVEFLVDGKGGFAFIETNARLQVEHTVTEEVTGLDLVRVQFELAAGKTLVQLGLTEAPKPRGFAVQARVNLETLTADGATLPGGGRLATYEPPSGPGVRVDGYGYAGYVTSPAYDSLLAKVIGRGETMAAACARTARALGEFRLDGVDTNAPLLRAVLAEPAVTGGTATTRFLEASLPELLAKLPAPEPRPVEVSAAAPEASFEVVEGSVGVTAPLQATVGVIEVVEGALVAAGQTVAILEAMKMEHVVTAPEGGRVVRIAASKGETLLKGQPILFLEPADVAADAEAEAALVDPDHIRPDLQEVIDRHAFTLDENRPESVARRRKTGHRTARENLDDLLDPGSFIEYGALTIAAQRRRRTLEDLIKATPADGLIAGIGAINGHLFTPRQGAGRGPQLRLHRPGRHPGAYEPQEDRPAAAHRRGPEAAAGLVRRGRRRAAGRHRRHGRGRAGRDHLRQVRLALRGSAEDRYRRRPLLRRQRGHRGPQRDHHRHEGLQPRHGRSGDDRGRRTGRVQA
jgi:acetyl/propionyl-CoA carboxylase alpha subunit